MSTSLPPLLAPMLSSAAMRVVCDDAACLQHMLDFEAALARAEVATGVIPASAAGPITNACKAGSFDLASLAEAATKSGNLAIPLVKALNTARRENPALQRIDNITFLETENEQLFAFLKRRGDNTVVTVVNLDPRTAQEGVCVVPVSTGLPPAYPVRDLLLDETWTWRIGRNYVKLAPGKSHVLRIGA